MLGICFRSHVFWGMICLWPVKGPQSITDHTVDLKLVPVPQCPSCLSPKSAIKKSKDLYWSFILPFEKTLWKRDSYPSLPLIHFTSAWKWSHLLFLPSFTCQLLKRQNASCPPSRLQIANESSYQTRSTRRTRRTGRTWIAHAVSLSNALNFGCPCLKQDECNRHFAQDTRGESPANMLREMKAFYTFTSVPGQKLLPRRPNLLLTYASFVRRSPLCCFQIYVLEGNLKIEALWGQFMHWRNSSKKICQHVTHTYLKDRGVNMLPVLDSWISLLGLVPGGTKVKLAAVRSWWMRRMTVSRSTHARLGWFLAWSPRHVRVRV